MICKENNINFTTVKPVIEIFSQAMDLMSAMSGRKIHNKRNRFLEVERDRYKESVKLMSKYSSFYIYLQKIYKHDIALISTIRLVMTVSFGTIMELYIYCKGMKKDKSIVLATAHSVKGVEYDNVYIEDDINKGVSKVLTGKSTLEEQEQRTELPLAYVACSRAKFKLDNCEFL